MSLRIRNETLNSVVNNINQSRLDMRFPGGEGQSHVARRRRGDAASAERENGEDMADENRRVDAERRGFLRMGLAFGAAALASGIPISEEAWAVMRVPARAVAMHNMHTGESVRVEYWVKGKYDPAAVRQIERLMRDHRTGQVHSIDRRLIDVVFQLQKMMGSKGPVNVVSGYRSPETNELLRETSDGVAQNSFHMSGRAVDLCFQDRPLRQLRRAALSLRAGGVGYYPGSGFVHVDTGPLRHW